MADDPGVRASPPEGPAGRVRARGRLGASLVGGSGDADRSPRGRRGGEGRKGPDGRGLDRPERGGPQTPGEGRRRGRAVRGSDEGHRGTRREGGRTTIPRDRVAGTGPSRRGGATLHRTHTADGRTEANRIRAWIETSRFREGAGHADRTAPRDRDESSDEGPNPRGQGPRTRRP